MSAGLSVLPPSPPTTTSRKNASLKEDIECKHTLSSIKGSNNLKDLPLGTPDESPASFPGSVSGSVKSRKKVEFSPWTNIHNAPVFTASSPNNVAVRPLLPSRELSSSASILKANSQLDPAPRAFEDQPQSLVNLVDMLESITHQLARNEIVESIDAYHTLSSTLKAYNEVPDSQTFKSKLGPLMQHIRRDLAVLDKSDHGPAEINLVTQTLKVLVILAWNRNFSILLSNEIQGFILDRAIHVLEEHKASKGVMLHYLHLLATQDFRHSIVASGGRVGRLLDALKDLTQHLRGNGIVSERLMVYQRLLEQARSHMKTKPLSWIHELFDGLTSLHQETRTKAMELGTKAVAVFPSSSTVSHALRTVLDEKAEDGKTAGAFACKRLEKMLASKDDNLVVPQIWAIILSLMKGMEGGIDKWNGLKDWLKVMQRCFNSSNSAVRTQANTAWSRFIYVVCPSEVTASLLSMLIKPIAAQMERKGMEREDRSSRATAFSAYCNLLYYSFRPSASHKQYDRVWDEYVVKVLTSSFLERSPAAADRTCRIFAAFFWNDNSRSKLWREVRAQENTLMEPEELPTIDCKWLRSKSSSILDIFKLLLQNSSWGSEDRPDQSFVATAWKHFSKALGAACRKEMKPSTETMQALTNTLAFLSAAWQTGPSALNAVEANVKDAFMIRFRFLCMTMLTEIGAIPLIEGNLTADSLKGHVRIGDDGESVPIIQFLRILSSVSKSSILSQTYCDLVKEILRLPYKARTPTRLRIRLFRQSAVSILVANPQTSTETARAYIWQAIALAVQEEFNSSDVYVHLEPEMDNVLEDVVKILGIGLAYSSTSAMIWCSLLNGLVHFAKHGEPQRTANISAIATSLTSYVDKVESESPMLESAELIQCVVPCIELSVARISPRHSKGKLRTKTTTIISPLFNKLLLVLNDNLEKAYKILSPERLQGISGTVEATCQCLRSCAPAVLISCLKNLESSLSLWLQDKQRLLTPTTAVGTVKLNAGRKMCSLLIDIFGKISEHGKDLEQLGSLLAAGFRSTHKLTINQMIEMWNTSFGSKKQLAYPEVLKAALDRLRPFVELELPSFGFDADNVDMVDAPTFINSQDEESQDRPNLMEPSNSKPRSTETCSLISPSPRKARTTTSPILTPQVARQARERTPVAVTSKPKPQHDDSQIQYIAVESSPLEDIDNESQYLTDRQKQVRARQQAEPAVVFPDLRSGPLPGKGPLKALRHQNLSLDLKRMDLIKDNEPTTPTLPIHPNGDGDDVMASSPTPRSKRPALRLDDIEVPSSPPSMPGVAEHDAPGEIGSVSVFAFAVQKDGSVVKSDVSLSPADPSQVNKVPRDQTDDASIAVEEQPIELDTQENNGEANNGALQNDDLGEHVPQLSSLLSAEHNNADSAVPSKLLATATASKTTVLNPDDHVETLPESEDMVNDVVIETTEAVHEGALILPPIRPEPEKLPHEMDGSFIPKNDIARTQGETGDEPEGSKEETSLDVEKTAMSRPVATAASMVDDERQMDKGLMLPRDHFNSPGIDAQFIPEHQVPDAAVLRNSGVIVQNLLPATPNSHSDSDEVDMLSASQLSQDLDWHVLLEEHASHTEPSLEAEEQRQARKRKRSIEYSAGAKRRKGTSSPTHQGYAPLTQPLGMPHQVKETEELFDCIVVDTTPRPSRAASQSSRPSQDDAHTQNGNKKRGHKRKQPGNLPLGQDLPLAVSHPSPQSEEVVKAKDRPFKQEWPSSDGVTAFVPLVPREILSPQVSPKVIRKDNVQSNSMVVEGTAIVSPPSLDSQVMAENLSASVLTEGAAIAWAGAEDDPVIFPDLTKIPRADDSPDTHSPLDKEGAESSPDMTNRFAAQQVRLPSDSGRVQGPPTITDCPPKAGICSVDLGTETAAETDIVVSLQQVLKLLKSASIGRPALRQVDDLLFEIRSEAQHAAERQIAKPGSYII